MVRRATTSTVLRAREASLGDRAALAVTAARARSAPQGRPAVDCPVYPARKATQGDAAPGFPDFPDLREVRG